MCRLILVLSCAFFVAITQTGCVGVILSFPEECKNETPYTGVHNIFWIPHTATPKSSTKAEFLKDWGKPDEIIHTSEKEETWIYNRKLWCGVIPVVLVPIASPPFILPVCDGFDRIKFLRDEATCLHTRQIVRELGVLAAHGKDPVCRHPVPPNQCVDFGTSKSDVQVMP